MVTATMETHADRKIVEIKISGSEEMLTFEIRKKNWDWKNSTTSNLANLNLLAIVTLIWKRRQCMKMGMAIRETDARHKLKKNNVLRWIDRIDSATLKIS